MNILINPEFLGMVERPNRKAFCPGWNIAFSGAPTENKYSFEYQGTGSSKRVHLKLDSVKVWFRIFQEIKLEKGTASLGVSITSSTSTLAGGENSRTRIRLMKITSRHCFTTAAVVDRNYCPTPNPQTSDYTVDVGHLDTNEQYALVIEFDNPTAINLWCTSLTLYNNRNHTLSPSSVPSNRLETQAVFTKIYSNDFQNRYLSEENFLDSPIRGTLQNHVLEDETPTFNSNVERVKDNEIIGWFFNVRNPSSVFTAELLIDGVPYGEVRNDIRRNDLRKTHRGINYGGFRLKVHKGLLSNGFHNFSLRYPDMSCSKEKRINVSKSSHETSPNAAHINNTHVYEPPSITVLVPVYNAYEDLVECIEKLRLHTPTNTNLLFINDASTDTRITPFLFALENIENITVLTNSTNRGFTNTVNRGIEYATGQDIVFLNSDARVTPGWLDSLQLIANSHPTVATVTPLSNNAGAFSAPRLNSNNELNAGISEDIFATLVRKNSLGLYPEIPTGNGFCMYVRRACIDDVGLLDFKSFPRGYGEENDFCMRALRAGWRHLLDDTSYVFHERSASFGNEKNDLIAESKKIVHSRYPEYPQLCKFFNSTTMKLVRYRVGLAKQELEQRESQLPRALYVYSGLTGGTPQTNKDLMGALTDTLDTWTLRCDSRTMYLERFNTHNHETIETHELEDSINPLTHVSTEYDNVATYWLRKYNFKLVHIRHLLWHSINLPKIAKNANCEVIFSFHDFYTACPTVKFIDGNSKFCGGNCDNGSGECKPDGWHGVNFPELRDSWIHRWRSMFNASLEYVDKFVTTSNSAANTLVEIYPNIANKLTVIPHGRSLTLQTASFKQPDINSRIKVLVPGNISIAKGLEIIAQIAAVDTSDQIEFHILGNVSKAIDLPDSVVVHGAYKRHEFLDKVNKIAPTVGAVFSIWDETYCHTLTEMWAAGLPVMVLNYGTLASRVKDSGAGWVLPHSDTQTLYKSILKCTHDFDDYNEKRLAAAKWQNSEGLSNTSNLMALKYLDLYRQIPSNDSVKETKTKRKKRTTRNFKNNYSKRLIAVLEGSTATTGSRSESMLRDNFMNLYERKFLYLRCSPATLFAGIETGEIENVVIADSDLPANILNTLNQYIDKGKINIVGSDYENSYLAKRDASATNLNAISTYSMPSLLLPTSIWGNIDISSRNANRRNVEVLYIHGDPFTNDDHPLSNNSDLSDVFTAFERATCEVPNLRLNIICNAPLVDTHETDWVDVQTPSSDLTYAEYIDWLEQVASESDFAIIPASSTASECDSELRFLEISALGLSGLYGNIPAFHRLTAESSIGNVVADSNEWFFAITNAANNHQHMRNDGRQVRNWIERTRLTQSSTLSVFDEYLHESFFETQVLLAS